MIARLAANLKGGPKVVILHASENVRDENYNSYTKDNNMCGKFLNNGKLARQINYLTMADFE